MNFKFNKDKDKETNDKDVERMAWICTAIAVCVGLVFTKEPACLWAFVLPLWL